MLYNSYFFRGLHDRIDGLGIRIPAEEGQGCLKAKGADC